MLGPLSAVWTPKAFSHPFRHFRRLVDDRSAVHDVDQPPGQANGSLARTAIGNGNEPNGYDRGLAEARRDVANLGCLAFYQPLVKLELPREMAVARESLEFPREFRLPRVHAGTSPHTPQGPAGHRLRISGVSFNGAAPSWARKYSQSRRQYHVRT